MGGPPGGGHYGGGNQYGQYPPQNPYGGNNQYNQQPNQQNMYNQGPPTRPPMPQYQQQVNQPPPPSYGNNQQQQQPPPPPQPNAERGRDRKHAQFYCIYICTVNPLKGKILNRRLPLINTSLLLTFIRNIYYKRLLLHFQEREQGKNKGFKK